MRYNFIYRLQFINAENPYNWALKQKKHNDPGKILQILAYTDRIQI